jgi:hypothetical protein
MRAAWVILAVCVGTSAYAAPPPDANGTFGDWFRSLKVPGMPGAMCCTVADCRMVDARWNDRTQHHEARVTRERFGGRLRAPVSQEDDEANEAAQSAWMQRWVTQYGDRPDVWIEIPGVKVNTIQNPTGHAVLCWSIFNSESNGVYCFVPFTAASNEWPELMNVLA